MYLVLFTKQQKGGVGTASGNPRGSAEQKGPGAFSFSFEIHIKNSFKGWFFCFLFKNRKKNTNSRLSPRPQTLRIYFWRKQNGISEPNAIKTPGAPQK